jgi:hypothetical protein
MPPCFLVKACVPRNILEAETALKQWEHLYTNHVLFLTKMGSDWPHSLIWLKIRVSLCCLHSCIFSEIRACVDTTSAMNIWNVIQNHSHTFKLLILPILCPRSIKVINMVTISLLSRSKCFRMDIKSIHRPYVLLSKIMQYWPDLINQQDMYSWNKSNRIK